MEPVNQKGGRRPKLRVVVHEAEAQEKNPKSKGYQVSPNYKGKIMMTRTQWRHYQRNKNGAKEAPTSKVRPVETLKYRAMIRPFKNLKQVGTNKFVEVLTQKNKYPR